MIIKIRIYASMCRYIKITKSVMRSMEGNKISDRVVARAFVIGCAFDVAYKKQAKMCIPAAAIDRPYGVDFDIFAGLFTLYNVDLSLQSSYS